MAVEMKNLNVCKALLANNDIDINLQSSNAEEIKKSINFDLRNHHRKNELRTALHLAVNNNDIEIIQLLLDNQKIDINSKDENGSTPINYTKNKKIIKMLKNT